MTPALDAGMGIRGALPLAFGVVPFAIAYAAAARGIGLDPTAVVAMSIVVFAGSAQFLAVALLGAGGGPIQIVVATIAVNSRHLLMSATLRARLGSASRGLRAALAYGVTDEAFAVVTSYPAHGTAFVAAAELTIWSAWIGGSLIGALLTSSLPPPLLEAASFSLAAFFIAAVARQLRGRGAFAAAVSSVILVLALAGAVPRGFEVLLAAGFGAFVGAWLERVPGMRRAR